jgi:peptidoglycan/LPS O-acetylase OafA/YrhL
VVQDGFRGDVEGLRALAVIVVVGYHARVAGFAGGFVGVDVFFVVSGYLITRLLLQELASNGRISLRGFWARRARRLLPASTLVIVATLLVGRSVLSPLALRSLATDAIAAATFVVNFVFANRLGDYFGAQAGETAPSPLLHFWSLAVEEQFYLVWPLVLVWLTRRARQYRRLLFVVTVAAATSSILTAIWLTTTRPTWAFYLLPARAGELLVGAALAIAGTSLTRVPEWWRATAGWVGLSGIAIAVVTFDATVPFPGTAVLVPVGATALVLLAGVAPTRAPAPTHSLGHPVLQWIGRHSYAIYLWHWPALVLAEAHYGPLLLPGRLLVVAMSVGLAVLSFRLVEDPVRHQRWLARRAGRGLALGAALCSLTLVVSWTTLTEDRRLDAGTIAAAPVLVASTTTTSPSAGEVAGLANAVAPTSTTSPVAAPLSNGDLATLTTTVQQILTTAAGADDVPANLRPSLAGAGGDRAQIYADGCVAIGVETAVEPCRYGDLDSDVELVLYGDSHAAQWFPALADLATARGVELVVMVKGGCPHAAVPIPTATLARTCPAWRDAAIAQLGTMHPEVLVTSSWARYPNDDDEWRRGFTEVVDRLAAVTDHLVVLGDTPTGVAEPAGCLSRNVRRASACTRDRSDAVAAARQATERDVAAAAGATHVDPTDWLCGPDICPVIVGDLLLYRDATHLTTVATTWLRPLLEAALTPVLSAAS